MYLSINTSISIKNEVRLLQPTLLMKSYGKFPLSKLILQLQNGLFFWFFFLKIIFIEI